MMIMERVKQGLICQACGEEMFHPAGRPVTCNGCKEKERLAQPPAPEHALLEQVKRLDATALESFSVAFAQWLVKRWGGSPV